ncbi:MAG: hypothetical protein GY909_01350 [Oligoflexia bacterium]|nr:hypothetical protein [Oligoflexia bacterium]
MNLKKVFLVTMILSLMSLPSVMASGNEKPLLPPKDQSQGFYLKKVKDGSILHKLGFRSKDTIIKINGKKIYPHTDMIKEIKFIQSAIILRDGEEKSFNFNKRDSK